MLSSTPHTSLHGYIDGHVKSVKSWLRYHDVEIRRKIKVSSAGSTSTLQYERIPDGQEMTKVYARSGLRESAIISLMVKSGLRPQVMGNHDGTDGVCGDNMVFLGSIVPVKSSSVISAATRHQFGSPAR